MHSCVAAIVLVAVQHSDLGKSDSSWLSFLLPSCCQRQTTGLHLLPRASFHSIRRSISSRCVRSIEAASHLPERRFFVPSGAVFALSLTDLVIRVRRSVSDTRFFEKPMKAEQPDTIQFGFCKGSRAHRGANTRGDNPGVREKTAQRLGPRKFLKKIAITTLGCGDEDISKQYCMLCNIVYCWIYNLCYNSI